jgi:hypothetical protein
MMNRMGRGPTVMVCWQQNVMLLLRRRGEHARRGRGTKQAAAPCQRQHAGDSDSAPSHPPVAGEGCGAGAAGHRIHALQRRGQGGRVAQVRNNSGEARRLAKQLHHLLTAAAQRPDLVAALQEKDAGTGTGCC